MSETLDRTDITKIPLDEKVGPRITDDRFSGESPIAAHVLMLLSIHHNEPIPDDVKQAALNHATERSQELQTTIESWNNGLRIIKDESIKEAWAKLFFNSAVKAIVTSYGNEFKEFHKLRVGLLTEAFTYHGMQEEIKEE